MEEERKRREEEEEEEEEGRYGGDMGERERRKYSEYRKSKNDQEKVIDDGA